MRPFPDDFREALADAPRSTLLAILDPASDPPGLGEVLDAIAGSGLQIEAVVEADTLDEDGGEPAEWRAEVELAASAEQAGDTLRIWLAAIEPNERQDLADSAALEEQELVSQCRFQLGLSLHLLGDPLAAFHRQLKLLAAIAEAPVLLLDVNATCTRPGAWLKDQAASSVPPAPACLYSIHAVTDDREQVWLHTHGLERAGTADLDLLAVPRDSASLGSELIARTAAMFLELGMPEPGETFIIGREIELVWLPWPAALEHAAPDTVGGPGDREDQLHTGPRVILLTQTAGNYAGIQSLLPKLADNPLLYVSAAETKRMALLASERLTRFLTLLAAHAEVDGWVFLVKLGYLVDGAAADGEREHLWFRAHGFDRGELDATLTNQPYSIAGMAQGERGRHALDQLTDWTIISPFGSFNAETITTLERRLLRQATWN